MRAKGTLTVTLMDLAQFFGTEIDHFAVPPAMCESAPLLLDCHLSLDFAHVVLFFLGQAEVL